MAIKNIRMRPEGVGDYSDILHPETNAAQVLDQVLFGTTAGTNTYTLTAPTVTSLYAGLRVTVKFAAANTGASTLNINSLGAKAIVKAGGTALTSGTLKLNGVYTLVYDGTSFQLQGEGDAGGGTAVASDLLSGKTAVSDAGAITGTMPNKGAKTFTPTTATQTDTAGYYSGLTCNPIPSNYLPISGTVLSRKVASGDSISVGEFVNFANGEDIVSNLAEFTVHSGGTLTGKPMFCKVAEDTVVVIYEKDSTTDDVYYRFITFSGTTPTITGELLLTGDDVNISSGFLYKVHDTLLLSFGATDVTPITLNLATKTLTLQPKVEDVVGVTSIDHLYSFEGHNMVATIAVDTASDDVDARLFSVSPAGVLTQLDSYTSVTADGNDFAGAISSLGDVIAAADNNSTADLHLTCLSATGTTTTLTPYTSGGYSPLAICFLTDTLALMVHSSDTIQYAVPIHLNTTTKAMTVGTAVNIGAYDNLAHRHMLRLNNTKALLFDQDNLSYRVLTWTGSTITVGGVVTLRASGDEHEVFFVANDKIFVPNASIVGNIIKANVITVSPLVKSFNKSPADAISQQAGAAGATVNIIKIP